MAKGYSSPKLLEKGQQSFLVLLNKEQTCLHTGGEMKKFTDILYSPYIILLNSYGIPIPEAQQTLLQRGLPENRNIKLTWPDYPLSSWPYTYTHSVSPCTYTLPPYCTIICNTALQRLMGLTLCIDFTGTFCS